MRIIGVNLNFNDLTKTQKTYAFNCYDDVNEGDYVVVDTANGFLLGLVVKIDMTSDKASKDVVSVVDMSAFNERKAKRERLLALKKEMDRKVKELQDLAIYEVLAEKDPELGKMLSELKELM